MDTDKRYFPHGPMEGIKIVEMSNMVTASLAAMILGQQGAEVVKVEPLGIGDKLRWFGSQKAGISGVFNNCNRGKQSLAIDLKSDAGQKAVRRLMLGADVLIHNYRPGVMTKLGLGSEALLNENPKLVICSITGFGRKGPLKDAPAFDHVVQALSGITAAQGKGDELEYIRMLVCDKITAYTACQGVAAALFQRSRTGEGQHMDISMLQAGMAFMWPDGMMHKTLLADDALHLAPMKDYYRTIETTDGRIAIAPFGDKHWRDFFQIIDRPDLAANPNYATLQSRGVHIGTLMDELSECKLHMSSVELLAALRAADIPCAPCLTADEFIEHEQITANEAVETQNHPHLGPVQMAAAPVHFGGQLLPPAGPSPLLGEHSETVLRDCGYGADDIAAMRQAGVI